MPLRDYSVQRDCFEDAGKDNISFPCNSCKHIYKTDSEEPCNRCDWNVNAKPEEEKA